MSAPVSTRLYRVELVEETHYALVVRATTADEAEQAATDAFLELEPGERTDALVDGGFLIANDATEVGDEEEGQ